MQNQAYAAGYLHQLELKRTRCAPAQLTDRNKYNEALAELPQRYSGAGSLGYKKLKVR